MPGLRIASKYLETIDFKNNKKKHLICRENVTVDLIFNLEIKQLDGVKKLPENDIIFVNANKIHLSFVETKRKNKSDN